MASLLTGGLREWEHVDKAPIPTPSSSPSPPLASSSSQQLKPNLGQTSADGQPRKAKDAGGGGSGGGGCGAKCISGPDALSLCSPIPSTLSLEDKIKVALSVAEECIKPEELEMLFAKKPHPIAYDGFEPSGRMHLAQGIMKAINVNKLTSAGCVFVFWVADWFAMLNNKLGGDLKKIRSMGEYFIEIWKAVGMKMDNVVFLWSSEEINADANTYWLKVMDIAREFNITRIRRCSQIMGRAEGDDQPAAQILYPCMQCADIFYLKVDICQLGMDQRKVNVLAREYCEAKKSKLKPIILSHPMLPGLLEGQEKMSKSDPDSAIFMEDSAADVNRKVKKAFCPPQNIADNPCVAYVKMLVFEKYGCFQVKRREQDGGDKSYDTVEEFEADYMSGKLHPSDLKSALSASINQMLQPVRQHFETDPHAKALLEKVVKYRATK